jgi:hypothetical protein
MKIAVVGGGIFGVTISTRLSKNHTVDLFEKNGDIMLAASDINQCRVHRGYHYPRSNSTVKEVLDANISFTEEFSEAIMNNTENYYCISKKDSLVSGDEFIKFCNENNLEYEFSTPNIINKESIELCIKVKENLFDHSKLKKICWNKLKESNVNVNLNTEVTDEIFQKYDFIIICTYGQTRNLLKEFPNIQKEYQYEVCEKIFVRLPPAFKNTSVLVMDGPFMGIDPIGDTGMFIIGDVIHTVIQRSVGKYPIIDQEYLPLLNKGIINNPPVSKFKQFIESGIRFMPELKNATYVGSSFCIKATLPNVDKTDERHTLIDEINHKVVTVFSGKIPTCVEAAKKIEKMLINIEKEKTK